jgi:hypothetical protein
VGRKQLEATRRYVAEQEKHHAIWTFQDEFRELMRRHGIDYDERYCWD